MAKIPQSIIDQILDRTDIVEVISGYVKMKKTGRNFKGCCPFHNEKTPSFVVSPDKQIYHCFGCNAGGNAIGFLMQYEKMSFPEAVRSLAGKSGIPMPAFTEQDKERDAQVTSLYGVNKVAANFYHRTLAAPENKKVLSYLLDRGITTDSIKTFILGYAQDSWDSLQRYARGKKISLNLLKEAGLSVTSSKGKNDYDRFRNRIIFPIFNERGNIQAFGARVLDKSLPKYINTPETTIYNKGSVLYGLNFARDTIREKGYVILVEGYLDVIIPYQNGVKNVVATSGTALTQNQVALIKKYTGEAVMIFDSDQAGEMASLRGLDILIENEVHVRIARLPNGEDPDSFIRSKGPDDFLGIVESAKDYLDYKLEVLIKKTGLKNSVAKTKIAGEMLPTIAREKNEVLKSEYLRKLAGNLDVDEASLRQEMLKVKLDYSYRREPEPVQKAPEVVCDKSELYMLGYVMAGQDMFDEFNASLGADRMKNNVVREVLREIGAIYSDDGQINPAKLISRLEDNIAAKKIILEALQETGKTAKDDLVKALRDCIFSFKNKELADRKKVAFRSNDLVEVKNIQSEILKLNKEKAGKF